MKHKETNWICTLFEKEAKKSRLVVGSALSMQRQFRQFTQKIVKWGWGAVGERGEKCGENWAQLCVNVSLFKDNEHVSMCAQVSHEY